jgi:hypothetical protein
LPERLIGTALGRATTCLLAIRVLRPRVLLASNEGDSMRAWRRLFLVTMAALGVMLGLGGAADAREFRSQVSELDRIPAMRAEFPVPHDPDMLFYIERSVNANTVVYAAPPGPGGRNDPASPIDVYWRWYNVDGHRKPLNFVERMFAYGVTAETNGPPGNGIVFTVAALPERQLRLETDDRGHGWAAMQFGDRTVRLVYVYLHVDDSGLTPTVTAVDLFGTDIITGRPLHERLLPK